MFYEDGVALVDGMVLLVADNRKDLRIDKTSNV